MSETTTDQQHLSSKFQVGLYAIHLWFNGSTQRPIPPFETSEPKKQMHMQVQLTDYINRRTEGLVDSPVGPAILFWLEI